MRLGSDQTSREWQRQWGDARDQLPEFPEDWVPVEDTTSGVPENEAQQHETLIRAMGEAIENEVIERAIANGATVPVYSPDVERLRHEALMLDRALASHLDDLLDEAAVTLYGPDGPTIIREDEDLRFDALVEMHKPNPARGKVAAELDLFLHQREYVSDSLLQHEAAYWDEQRLWSAAVYEEYRSIIKQLRTLGPAATRSLFTNDPTDPQLADAFDRASLWIPRDWLEVINSHGPWTIHPADRAWTDLKRRSVGVAAATNRTTSAVWVAGAAHQFGHLAQATMPHLNRLSWVFVTRRTSVDGRLLPTLNLSDVSPAYHETETYRDGNFANRYIGRSQETPRPTDTYQVLPVGLQGIITGWPDLTPDPDLRHFVLGVLSSA